MTTAIQWTDETWNPIRGCSRVSPGCERCYAERHAARFCGPGLPFEGFAIRKLKVISDDDQRLEPRWTGTVELQRNMLDQPLRWRKPRRVFVNSMSDLFHEGLSDGTIATIFGVMAAAPQHTFQILTKRADRMASLCADPRFGDEVVSAWRLAYAAARPRPQGYPWPGWPLPNVHLGVSVENQEYAEKRIPPLLATPAAVRFLSVEPMLGPVDLGVALRTVRNGENASNCDWVICGGESGPGARDCEVRWIRSIVEQCKIANVPVFVKQLGARALARDVDDEEDNLWSAVDASENGHPGYPYYLPLRSTKGGDPGEWPMDLRVREFPRRP